MPFCFIYGVLEQYLYTRQPEPGRRLKLFEDRGSIAIHIIQVGDIDRDIPAAFFNQFASDAA